MNHIVKDMIRVFEENFEINEAMVDALVLQIKIMRWIFKSFLFPNIGFIAREIEYIVDKYDDSNGNVEHMNG